MSTRLLQEFRERGHVYATYYQAAAVGAAFELLASEHTKTCTEVVCHTCSAIRTGHEATETLLTYRTGEA